MPKLIIEGFGEFEVPKGTRLVRAIEDSGVDILHRCGGNARCTTCRVKFHCCEPEKMTQAERDKLAKTGKQMLTLAPETAGRVYDRYFNRPVEPLFVIACGAIIKTAPVLCELIAKRGRASNMHLLAAYPEPEDVPPALQANAQVLRI